MERVPNLDYRKLHEALLTGDSEEFRRIRYEYSQEGDVFLIEGLDLEGADLSHIPSSWLVYKQCNLRNASFVGADLFPTAFWECDARGIDLSDADGMLACIRCDLRGANFNQNTNLYPMYRTDNPSAFEQCRLDPAFADFLTSQGVPLRFRSEDHVPGYFFEISPRDEAAFLRGDLE